MTSRLLGAPPLVRAIQRVWGGGLGTCIPSKFPRACRCCWFGWDGELGFLASGALGAGSGSWVLVALGGGGAVQ